MRIPVKDGRGNLVGKLEISEDKLQEQILTLEWRTRLNQIHKISLPIIKPKMRDLFVPYHGWYILTKWKERERLKHAGLLLYSA